MKYDESSLWIFTFNDKLKNERKKTVIQLSKNNSQKLIFLYQHKSEQNQKYGKLTTALTIFQPKKQLTRSASDPNKKTDW